VHQEAMDREIALNLEASGVTQHDTEFTGFLDQVAHRSVVTTTPAESVEDCMGDTTTSSPGPAMAYGDVYLFRNARTGWQYIGMCDAKAGDGGNHGYIMRKGKHEADAKNVKNARKMLYVLVSMGELGWAGFSHQRM
jgi:hypothetical protein